MSKYTIEQSAFDPYYKPLPKIKGYCKDCKYYEKTMPTSVLFKCTIFSLGNNIFIPPDKFYCEYWKVKK